MKSKWPLYYSASEKTVAKATKLRRELTQSEKILWNIIRSRKIKGFKFRRQHAIQYYIADFYCHEAKLIIELDGDVHDVEEVKEYDKRRQKIIEKLGLKVIRFSNELVLSNPDIIIQEIEKHLLENKNS